MQTKSPAAMQLSALLILLLASGLFGCNKETIVPADWPMAEVTLPPGSTVTKLPPHAVPEGEKNYGHHYVQNYPPDGSLPAWREWMVGFKTNDKPETLRAFYDQILLPQRYTHDETESDSLSYVSPDSNTWVAVVTVESHDMHILIITKYEEDAPAEK